MLCFFLSQSWIWTWSNFLHFRKNKTATAVNYVGFGRLHHWTESSGHWSNSQSTFFCHFLLFSFIFHVFFVSYLFLAPKAAQLNFQTPKAAQSNFQTFFALEITTLQFVRIHSVNRKVLNENKTKRQRAKNNKKKELKVIIVRFGFHVAFSTHFNKSSGELVTAWLQEIKWTIWNIVLMNNSAHQYRNQVTISHIWF